MLAAAHKRDAANIHCSAPDARHLPQGTAKLWQNGVPGLAGGRHARAVIHAATHVYSYVTRRITSEAFVPPNPNEFDSTVLISRALALCGTRSMAVSTDGLSRFSVGGTI